jgi:hypothetical protein
LAEKQAGIRAERIETNMPHFGISEILIITLVALIKYAIPIAFAIWVIVSLKRIRSGQEVAQGRLDAIEKRLSQNGN